MSSFPRFKRSMLSVLVFLLVPLLCKATITLTATGQHFASSPDEHVGTRFLQGFEYLARLQVFSQDLELCPEDSPHSHLNLTVDVPPDGLPGTYCFDSVEWTNEYSAIA